MENKDFLIFQKNQECRNSSNDYVLLMDSKTTKTLEEKCPFCQTILENSHSENCLFNEHNTISNWFVILPIISIIILISVWLKYKLKKKKSG